MRVQKFNFDLNDVREEDKKEFFLSMERFS